MITTNINKKKNKRFISIFVAFIMAVSFMMLLTGCGNVKNYSEKEVKSYLNKVYGKDMYTITNQTKEDDQTDIYEIDYDDVIFTVKSYVNNNKKSIEDQYCVAKSEKFFKEHDWAQIVTAYLDKNINIRFYSQTVPSGTILGNITINRDTDLNELADLIVMIDSDLALEYNEEVSTKYDFMNSPGNIAIAKNWTVDITEYDSNEKSNFFHFSYSDDTRLKKQDVLAQLEKDFVTK